MHVLDQPLVEPGVQHGFGKPPHGDEFAIVARDAALEIDHEDAVGRGFERRRQQRQRTVQLDFGFPHPLDVARHERFHALAVARVAHDAQEAVHLATLRLPHERAVAGDVGAGAADQPGLETQLGLPGFGPGDHVQHAGQIVGVHERQEGAADPLAGRPSGERLERGIEGQDRAGGIERVHHVAHMTQGQVPLLLLAARVLELEPGGSE